MIDSKPEIEIIILAAGKGTRMCSDLPKVLHPIAGRPMLSHVLDTAFDLEPMQIQVVVGHDGDAVKTHIEKHDKRCIRWVHQAEQLGTGHAVAQAKEKIDDKRICLILYGDVPLVDSQSLHLLCQKAANSSFAVLSAVLPDPAGYGRIIRNNGYIQRIIEHKDARQDELLIDEINTGIMAISGKLLKKYLSKLNNVNVQNEYYLTDIVSMAYAHSVSIESVIVEDYQRTEGINNRMQQAMAERYFQSIKAKQLLQSGVSLIDPARVDIRGTLTTGKDVSIDVNCIFEGDVVLGNQVTIGANVIIRNCRIDDDCQIESNCVLEDSQIGSNCQIGPFARIRPDTRLAGDNKVGNFVEIKKSSIDKGSKVNHLSYIGDTKMGANCNIGAGAITCNYDGAFKHQTTIGNDVFVGSGVELVAPINIQSRTTIGAGSTLNKDIGNECESSQSPLAISRSPTKIIPNWNRPKK